MAKTVDYPSQNLTLKIKTTEGLTKSRRFKDDFTLFICDRCSRQCALLTKEIHKPPYCPFLEFETDNASYIFKF